MKKIAKYRSKPGKPGEFERFNEESGQWEPTMFDGAGKPQNVTASAREAIVEAHGAKVTSNNTTETNAGGDSRLEEAGRTLGLSDKETKLFAQSLSERTYREYGTFD